MKTRIILFAGVGAMVLFLIGAISASAQTTTTGSIDGTVTDQTGAAVAGALVSVAGANMSSPRTTRTNGSGGFSFTGLQPGTYTVQATAPNGSQTSEQKNVNVRAGKTTTLRIRLRRRE